MTSDADSVVERAADIVYKLRGRAIGMASPSLARDDTYKAADLIEELVALRCIAAARDILSDATIRAPHSPTDTRRVALEERLNYWKDHSLTSGWTGAESGPCCDKCAMRDEHFDGRADALKAKIGCRDPFQINCRCHIPHREAIKSRMIQELSVLKPEGE